MDNPIILYEIAKLHQIDLDKEITLILIAKQAARPGLIKRFTTMRVSPKEAVRVVKAREAFTR